VHSETTVSSTAETDSTASAQSLSQGIFRDLEHTRQQIYSFWQRKGLGERYGGFYGTLDRAGASVSPSTKGLVQQARHVW
jgi:mannose/cellobiose epimerase-like protein (N-acyl-D-glucosamine 2-epimerase family)